MLVWPMAATAPSTIDSIETSTMICCHSWNALGKACSIARRNIDMAATLGDMAKKAVTGVGAPS